MLNLKIVDQIGMNSIISLKAIQICFTEVNWLLCKCLYLSEYEQGVE